MLHRAPSHPRYRLALFAALALFPSLGFGLDPHRDLRQYGQRSWQTDNGLPQNTVHAVIQSRDGYIWLATEGGLVRYDGVQFVVYDKRAPARLPSSGVNSIFEDSGGDLWIGTEDGLARRHGQEFAAFGDGSGLPSKTIWSVLEDQGGTIWIVTPAGLARYRDGSFDPFPIADGVASPKSVAEASDGSLWIGTHAGLVHLKDSRFEGVPLPPGLEVRSVAVTPDGRIWAGTPGGLYSFAAGKRERVTTETSLGSSEITCLRTSRGGLWVGTARGLTEIRNGSAKTYTAREGLPSDRIASIDEDREGALWIATDHGLARIFNGQVQALDAREELSGGLVLSILEDREGSVWLGTESGGLEMLHDQKFSNYTAANGLTGDLVRSVIQDRAGVVWVGTNGGGLDRFDNGKFSSVTTADGLSSDIVLALGSDTAGDLWVGTPDGLNRLQGGHRITVFTSADGLADDFVRSLYAAPDGSMWIGTRRGLSHLENGRFSTYFSTDGLGSDLVGAMVAGPDGSVWIGTLGGLTRFDRGKFTTLTIRDGLTSNVITALFQDSEGTLWIGTDQGGLNRLREGKITAYPPETSHLPESVYGILEDTRGNLWLSSKTGIYRVSKQALKEFAARPATPTAPDIYGTADGMKIDECSNGGHPAAWKLADGAMWFATLKGVATVDPERLMENPLPPPVAIEQLLIDDQPIEPTNTLKVDPGKSRFEFRYAGLSYIAPQKVRYRYKLEGFDHDWVDAGPRRIAYFTNLPAGRYRFHILACNNDGVWNEIGTTIDVQLRPHYYQTYWFYLLLALGVALLAYQIYRWQLRQVELRYDAVLSERGRIAREIHDTLAQGLVGISVQLELVNRLLSSSIVSARVHLDQARSLVKEGLTEARSSIWELRSQAAETEDFAGRLARMAVMAVEGSDPKIQVKSKISGAYRPLPPRAEAELLRIAQEAVANAVRHAKPERIAIDLRFAARELQMTIRDDGCGFDGQPHPQSSGPEGHFGLTGMRERAAQIGGTLAIDSGPGRGTEVSIHLPIDG